MLDKIKKSINKSVTTVSVKSSTLLEATKLKGFINSLNEQKEEMIASLGKSTYRMFLEDELNIDEIKKQCSEIAAIEDKITERQGELEKIQNEEKEILGTKKEKDSIICSCGQTLDPISNFCIKCGKKIN